MFYRPVLHAPFDALSIQRVQHHIESATAANRYHGPLDPEQFLRQHHAVVEIDGTLHPTIPGLMMFGHNPQSFLPHAMIDLAQFYGTQPLSYEVLDLQKSIGGCLPDQINYITTYLQRHTLHGFRLGEGAQRIEEHEYLFPVLREVTVNAVAHRDYDFEQSVIRVSLFRDRIEWSSPGSLPSGVTLDNILDAQVARNPAILMLLHQAGYVEAFGMGLNTVFAALAEEGLPAPKLVELPTAFIATVYGRPRSDFEPDESHSHTTQLDALTPVQRRIYTFIREQREVSIAQIEAHITGRSRRTTQRDLKSLQDAGLIDTVGSTWNLRYIIP